MTLLLGPPSSGKTTLLLALAGRLGKDLKVRKLKFRDFLLVQFISPLVQILIGKLMNVKSSGRVTYNGHGMEEFVPQRTSAYISQNDLHIGEMTVKETLAFSARCQGVGSNCG